MKISVPTASARAPYDWDVILAYVPAERKEETKRVILGCYTDAFLDGDHPVEWDGGGVIRFKADPVLKAIENAGLSGFNEISLARYMGIIANDAYLKIHRGIGYSLSGYLDLSGVREALGIIDDDDDE